MCLHSIFHLPRKNFSSSCRWKYVIFGQNWYKSSVPDTGRLKLVDWNTAKIHIIFFAFFIKSTICALFCHHILGRVKLLIKFLEAPVVRMLRMRSASLKSISWRKQINEIYCRMFNFLHVLLFSPGTREGLWTFFWQIWPYVQHTISTKIRQALSKPTLL